VQCNMTFIVVDTKNYDILLGLDLLIKIRVVVDVKIDLTLKQKCKYYHYNVKHISNMFANAIVDIVNIHFESIFILGQCKFRKVMCNATMGCHIT
jgi:hypothetical protein